MAASQVGSVGSLECGRSRMLAVDYCSQDASTFDDVRRACILFDTTTLNLESNLGVPQRPHFYIWTQHDPCGLSNADSRCWTDAGSPSRVCGQVWRLRHFKQTIASSRSTDLPHDTSEM